jgi:hypothetical protein
VGFDPYNEVQMERGSRTRLSIARLAGEILGFGFTVMRAAMRAAVKKGFFGESGRQPMAAACHQNGHHGHCLRRGIISDLSLNRPRTRSIFRFGRTELFFAFRLFWSHKGRSRVARMGLSRNRGKWPRAAACLQVEAANNQFAERASMAGANNKLETSYRSMVVL